MYSWILRFIYSFTYYIHFGIVWEFYQINKHGLIPACAMNQTLGEYATSILQIHYPLLPILLCLIIAKVMVRGTKHFARTTTQMKEAEPFGIELLYTGIQIIPYLSFVFREKLFGLWGASALILVTVLFLTRHGSYNISLLFLGYSQYKVKTENSTIWLVSKRKISNFSNSETVQTLQDNVFVRYE